MYSRILTPLDGSSLSEQVLPYVRQLAFGLAVPVTLITVAEPVTPVIGRSDAPATPEYESETHLEDHAGSYLNGVVSGLREGRLEVSTVTPPGTRPRKSSPRPTAFRVPSSPCPATGGREWPGGGWAAWPTVCCT